MDSRGRLSLGDIVAALPGLATPGPNPGTTRGRLSDSAAGPIRPERAPQAAPGSFRSFQEDRMKDIFRGLEVKTWQSGLTVPSTSPIVLPLGGDSRGGLQSDSRDRGRRDVCVLSVSGRSDSSDRPPRASPTNERGGAHRRARLGSIPEPPTTPSGMPHAIRSEFRRERSTGGPCRRPGLDRVH